MQAEAVMLKDVFPYLRRRGTFVRRLAYGGVTAVAVALGGGASAFGGAALQARTGAVLFDVMLWTILCVGVLECTFLGATSISIERQNNTFDLWILAGMEHFGVVAAKAASVLVRASSAVLAPLCPTAVALYLGGRSVADATVGFLAIVSILVFVTALSVSVSSVYRKASDSVAATIAAVLAFAITPGIALSLWASSGVWGRGFAAWAMQVHPFTLLGGIGEKSGAGFVLSAFGGLGLSAGASAALVTLAGVRLRGGGSAGGTGLRPFRAMDAALERALPWLVHFLKPLPGDVDAQPARWRERIALANRKRLFGGMTVSDKLALTAAAAATALAVSAPATGGAAVTSQMATWAAFGAVYAASYVYTASFLVRASQGFSREFETQDMELLRLTDLQGEIASGKMQAYVRHFVPVAAMNVVMAAVFAYAWLEHGGLWQGQSDSALGSAPVRLLGFAAAGFEATAIGLFSSLYFRKSTHAMFAALAGYLALPMVGWAAGGGVLSVISMILRGALPLWSLQLMVGLVLFAVFVFWSPRYKASPHSTGRDLVMPAAVAAAFANGICGEIMGPLVAATIIGSLMVKNYTKLAEVAYEPGLKRRPRGFMLPAGGGTLVLLRRRPPR